MFRCPFLPCGLQRRALSVPIVACDRFSGPCFYQKIPLPSQPNPMRPFDYFLPFVAQCCHAEAELRIAICTGWRCLPPRYPFSFRLSTCAPGDGMSLRTRHVSYPGFLRAPQSCENARFSIPRPPLMDFCFFECWIILTSPTPFLTILSWSAPALCPPRHVRWFFFPPRHALFFGI